MINILLNGCKGNMGKALIHYIENSKSSSEFSIMYGIDKENINLLDEIKDRPDVIIDFSNPFGTFACLNYAVRELIPVVIATTGFTQEDNEKIAEYSEAIPIFKSSNMSYGINLFSNLVASFAQKLNNMNIDIEIIEKHHRKKIDAPSGTAIMLANKINEKCNNKYTFVFDRSSYENRKNNNQDIMGSNTNINKETNIINKNVRNYNEIGFSSVRGGELVGEHSVLFLGENEKIELTHTAYSRNIYIEGALSATKFIINKKNGLYSMEDLIL